MLSLEGWKSFSVVWTGHDDKQYKIYDDEHEQDCNDHKLIINQSDDQKFKGAQVWDFDVLDFNDFFNMKSI